MAESIVLYYITDRSAFPGSERARRLRLFDKIAEAAQQGVDYVQLWEKDLSTRELELLARDAMEIICNQEPARGDRQSATALLINSRTDVALASGAAGVHLRADDVSPEIVRAIWTSAGSRRDRENAFADPVIAVSCHSQQEVARAAETAAAFAVFAPVFEKKDAPGTSPAGLDSLRRACRAKIPVLALGGITPQNAEACLLAGSAGIAAIRLFQENDIGKVVSKLRGY